MNVKLVVIVSLLLLGATILLILGLSSGTIESHSVAAVISGTYPPKGLDADKARSIDFKITGHCVEYDPANPRELLVGAESPKRAPNQPTLRVRLADEAIAPEGLAEEAEIMAAGSYDRVTNVFTAHTLQAKCPSAEEAKLDPGTATTTRPTN